MQNLDTLSLSAKDRKEVHCARTTRPNLMQAMIMNVL